MLLGASVCALAAPVASTAIMPGWGYSPLFAVTLTTSWLVVKYFFIKRVAIVSWQQALLRDVAAVCASLLLIYLFSPLFNTVMAALPRLVTGNTGARTAWIFDTFLTTVLSLVLLAGAAETGVLIIGFKHRIGYRGFGWMLAANAVSFCVVLGIFALLALAGRSDLRWTVRDRVPHHPAVAKPARATKPSPAPLPVTPRTSSK